MSSLLASLRTNPLALETAWLSVITFGARAQQAVPLTELLQFQTPGLRLGSGTALGAALNLWERCMAKEVVTTTAERKGDYKPICFILTDGSPTDDWQGAADRVYREIHGRRANIIGVACGPDADTKALLRITETVVSLRGGGAEELGRFFQWVSASIATASRKFGEGGGEGISLPNLPQGMDVATREQAGPPVDPRFLFLHSRCVRDGAFCLMRFRRVQGDSGQYQWVASQALDDFDFGPEKKGRGTAVSSEALLGPAPCPCCGNKWWGTCAAGHLHCYPETQEALTLTCPWCRRTAQYASGAFRLGSGSG